MESVDALVVGAGPVGLTMALELVRHGLTVRIIDLAEAPTTYSKAQVVHSRTLEIAEDMGVVEAMLTRGKMMHGVRLFSRDKREAIAHVRFPELDAPYPFPLSLPQRDTEQILEAALRERGKPVERKVKLDRFSQDENVVRAVLVHEGGREEELRVSWLLGCDGAHSTVRAGLGMELEGSTYEFRLVQADVRVDLPFAVPDDEITGFLHPKGPLGLLPLPGEHRYRMLVFLEPGEEREATLESFREVMKERGPEGAVVDDPVWMVGFRIHARLARSLRAGRVFLAGDAAHIHSPAGGQGMNMGMQDAYNLAWKIALVQKGHGKPILLDSYGAERHPIHQATLASTDAATRRGNVFTRLSNRLAIELRNQVIGFVTGLGFVQEAVTRGLSMLDIGYEKSPIVAQSKKSVLQTDVVADRGKEAPSLSDWMHFGSGPAPGMRALDAPLSDDRTLFRLFAGTHHTLLLFDGAAATQAGYENLARIAAAVKKRCGDRVRTYVIVPHTERPASLPPEVEVVLDPEGAAHKRYEARSECLYVIRPDKHVGFRSLPAEEDVLSRWLDEIFT